MVEHVSKFLLTLHLHDKETPNYQRLPEAAPWRKHSLQQPDIMKFGRYKVSLGGLEGSESSLPADHWN